MRQPALITILLGASLLSAPAMAQTLRIALASEPTAVDPHYHDLTPNNALAMHIFDGLVLQDEKQALKPGLAASWENDGKNRWTFKLRQGVTFTNGKPFTAEDVVFTFCRTLKNETKVSGSFADITGNFASVETPDAHTLVINTTEPEPLLPTLLSGLPILTASIVEHGPISYDVAKNCGVTGPWPTVNNFNDGTAAIGTGPYKLKSYVRGSAIELERNPSYWGPAEPWANVRFLPVTNAGPRLAGLLAGDYDVIENPAARDLARLKGDKRFGHVITPSTRVIYFQLDVARDESPFVKAPDGKNPLKDVRVRKAMSLAIDRDAIVKRIMDGAAEPAYQYLPTGMSGTLANPPKLAYDPAAAKKLLAEAGYPNGFQLTLSSTNDRYINDSQITQAVAQYLTQIGIKTEVDAMTRAIYFPRRAKKEFSVALGGWGSGTGEAASFLRQWPPTPNEAKTLGGSNYGGYKNEEFDKVIRAAVTTLDDKKRAELLQRAMTLVLADGAFIPLHFESGIWAFKSELAVAGRADQYMLAMSVKPAK
ncbi:ABC transporter substrate-binding protein [Bosea psychrotolerans]|uniref:Peptide/nickel transport system substrate-binding protein n=1 Tax=Bosea psychrotolerans TaxID=1871628 RepID=A0A2S4MAY9_9HYPH|nr:ABC transporter substrate-binding protein [Bosea psychrotolerans]POR51920.1 peptide/nickel transport system substrate-binding protein [Bosea psychrotolerans]